MESVSIPAVVCGEADGEIVKRRVALARCYESLPSYGTPAFWQAIEITTIPLEILVRFLRVSLDYRDEQGRNRLFTIILRRTQASNEYWASFVLNTLSVQGDERQALLCDLCADLYESLLRALMDPRRSFWEENFAHSLQFERRHVHQAFMVREGRWRNPQVKRTMRVPRALVESIDQPRQQVDGDSYLFEIEDEQAQKMLLAVEMSDLLYLVWCLPSRLKFVVLLFFWEGRSEHDIARSLGITDRTVRNRKRAALNILRELLNVEKKVSKNGEHG